jgi:hypothetical protein
LKSILLCDTSRKSQPGKDEFGKEGEMPRVVPSQIVEFIDQTIPKAKKPEKDCSLSHFGRSSKRLQELLEKT